MEPYENENENTQFSDNTPPASGPQQPYDGDGAYHGTGAGRRESPYENAPYEMRQPPRDDSYYYRQAPQPPRRSGDGRKPHRVWRGVVAAVLAVALVAGGCLITAASVNNYWREQNASLTSRINDLEKQLGTVKSNSGSGTVTQHLPTGSQMSPNQLYAQNVDSVVAISSTVESAGFYGVTEGTASGSGFILTQDGYIVTNSHVVEGASSISVILHDGTEYAATVKGSDSANDIAVLKVDATDLPAASIGKSGEMNIGDMVVAIGNPLGTLASTQTVGYVSGINREVATDSSIISMIQTDAAINPGNSGGPLFNMQGQVVGITTAKYSGTTNSGASIEGIGFAIPIDDVLPIINDLIEHGYVTGAYMGVTVKNTDADSAAMFGLPTGAYVLETVQGGSADRAGIQVKDIIIRLDDTTVSSVTDLTRALRQYKAGDTVAITLIRGGKEITLDVTLDEKPQPEEEDQGIPEPDANMPSEGSYDDWYEWFFGNRRGK